MAKDEQGGPNKWTVQSYSEALIFTVLAGAFGADDVIRIEV